MRIKTRSGFCVSVPDDSIVSQQKRITRHETYYVIFLQDGRNVHSSDPVPGIKTEVFDERKAREEVKVDEAPPYNPQKLQSASELPSAGGAMVASKAMDKHSADKVKGETFFSHKSDSGLVIKSPQGQVIHETKVTDMYKRR